MEDAQPQQALADWIRRDYAGLEASCTTRAAASWKRHGCRACGASALVQVLSLGEMPPANAFLRPDELTRPEPRFPLSLRLCERCGMVQLGHVVPPQLLFRSYLFFTSSSLRMTDHFSALMTANANAYVRPGGLVVEIGSNDGTALSSIQRRDVRVLGIDPARNVSVMAAARGVPTVSEFFTEPLGREIARVAGHASLIVACNVLGHIDDLDDVCRGVDALLASDGALVFEVPYLRELMDRGEYDTVYHEHLSYFAVRPLATLLNRHGLRLEKVELMPVHGGTLRGTALRGGGCSDDVQRLIAAEAGSGVGERRAWAAFAQRVEAGRAALRDRLLGLRAAGTKVIGYGAPAKGSVVLNYCGIGTDLLPVVLDSTPAKQGLHVPGTHQPILPPSALPKEDPGMLLLLAWNHAPEILEREKPFRARGGRFLTPHLLEY
ncbi:MAG: class I SAM-dependent methyltransferase [Tepidisphaeraceae bacterium]|jgi:novobiocin biosynthesis protein NovU/D-mycarose 3-C-methyltransferase